MCNLMYLKLSNTHSKSILQDKINIFQKKMLSMAYANTSNISNPIIGLCKIIQKIISKKI